MRRNAVIGVLLFVALWPLAHRAAVARWEIDPWKLSGFAMYATPSLPVLVAAMGSGPSGSQAVDEAALPAWTRQRLDRFRAERLALGRLRDPADVGRALLIARPDLASVDVLIQRSLLDPRTALIATSVERHTYRR